MEKAKCSYCKKGVATLDVKCRLCAVTFYCDRKCKKKHQKKHRKLCTTVSEATEKHDMLDFLERTADVLTCDYINLLHIEDGDIGDDGKLILCGFELCGVRTADGCLHYYVKPEPNKLISECLLEVKNDFSIDDFWTVFASQKNQVFNSAVVMALWSLTVEYGLKFDCLGLDVISVGIAEVSVVKEYTPKKFAIMSEKTHSGEQSEWFEADRTSDIHNVVYFTTSDYRRYLVDFTGYLFDNTDKTKLGNPLHICLEDSNECSYAVRKTFSSSTVTKLFETALEQELTRMDKKDEKYIEFLIIKSFKDHVIKLLIN